MCAAMQGMSCLHPLQIHVVAGCKLLQKSEFQKWHKVETNNDIDDNKNRHLPMSLNCFVCCCCWMFTVAVICWFTIDIGTFDHAGFQFFYSYHNLYFIYNSFTVKWLLLSPLND